MKSKTRVYQEILLNTEVLPTRQSSTLSNFSTQTLEVCAGADDGNESLFIVVEYIFNFETQTNKLNKIKIDCVCRKAFKSLHKQPAPRCWSVALGKQVIIITQVDQLKQKVVINWKVGIKSHNKYKTQNNMPIRVTSAF